MLECQTWQNLLEFHLLLILAVEASSRGLPPYRSSLQTNIIILFKTIFPKNNESITFILKTQISTWINRMLVKTHKKHPKEFYIKNIHVEIIILYQQLIVH